MEIARTSEDRRVAPVDGVRNLVQSSRRSFPVFRFVGAKGDDERGRQIDGPVILNQQAEPVAELDDQSRLDLSGKLHFQEADILANNPLTRAGPFSGPT